MRDFTFSIESEIHSTKEILWQYVTQMKNVNAELMPFAKMTYPKEMSEIGNPPDGRAGNDVPMHQVLFKSVILLFGFIPIDRHYLRLDRIDFGTAFYENSYSLQHHYWKHTRTISECNGKIFVKDELHFAPRISFLGYLFLSVYKIIFANRHKQLRKVFS
jgi:ligand-binding SRPBCC domain-containing protein